MQIKKSVLVEYPAEYMYQLVYRIEDYSDFLPWCSKTEILRQKDLIVEARIYMDYLMIKQSFTTENTHIENQEIHMVLVDGPFKYLDGYWKFLDLGTLGCQIDFILEYEFTNHFISRVLGPVFHMISSTLVDAFIKEANRRYVQNLD
ncbi:MAG: ubiquinone-binding protein [Neisseriaceae bacterium]|nr:MAG: ubiquinone-binding protein [Neisseriaceae bacterium]